MIQKNLHKNREGNRSLFGSDTLSKDELLNFKQMIENDIAATVPNESYMTMRKRKLLLEQALKDVNDALK